MQERSPEQVAAYNELCNKLAGAVNDVSARQVLSYADLLAAASIIFVGIVRGVEGVSDESQIEATRLSAIQYIATLIHADEFLSSARDAARRGQLH